MLIIVFRVIAANLSENTNYVLKAGQHEFRVHRKRIIEKSAYFETMLSGRWKARPPLEF